MILDNLLQQDVILHQDYERICDMCSRRRRVDALMAVILRSDSRACLDFLECLNEGYPYLVDSLTEEDGASSCTDDDGKQKSICIHSNGNSNEIFKNVHSNELRGELETVSIETT